jgi:hypothetical protein
MCRWEACSQHMNVQNADLWTAFQPNATDNNTAGTFDTILVQIKHDIRKT